MLVRETVRNSWKRPSPAGKCGGGGEGGGFPHENIGDSCWKI